VSNRRGIHYKTLLSCSVVALLAFSAVGSQACAQQFQWPEEPENLQVLPEGTKGRQLGMLMRGFATSLGVRCQHCHVGEGNDLTTFDFPADDKPTKEKARLMIKMVMALNTEHLPGLNDIEDREEPILEVECITCHRRQPRPVMLRDIMLGKIESDGVDAAITEYRSLREQYYGGFSYDFSAGGLTSLGERLGRDGDADSAVRLIELEIEMNGESPAVYFTLGGILAGASRTAEAIESFTKGRDMAPEDWKPFFQAEIDRLTGDGVT